MTLRALVLTALNNAFDNGYDFRSTDPAEVVEDLQSFDSQLEAETEANLLPLVKEWQADKRK